MLNNWIISHWVTEKYGTINCKKKKPMKYGCSLKNWHSVLLSTQYEYVLPVCVFIIKSMEKSVDFLKLGTVLQKLHASSVKVFFRQPKKCEK